MLGLPNTKERAEAQHATDLAKKGEIYQWGTPYLKKMMMGLEYGWAIFASPPNVGKSTLMLHLYHDLLENNNDLHVLDFSLDDSFAKRFRSAIASKTSIPINWISTPSYFDEIPDGAQKFVEMESAIKDWYETIAPRLTIIDQSDFDGKANNINIICDAVKRCRDTLDENKKLVIIIDGVHNISLGSDIMVKVDDNRIMSTVSESLKKLTDTEKVVIFSTAHTPKGKNRRGVDQDGVKDTTKTTYDAVLIAMLYSDWKLNRDAAEVYFEEASYNGDLIKRPVLEVNVVKSKINDFNSLVFFKHWPEFAKLEEPDSNYQRGWTEILMGS